VTGVKLLARIAVEYVNYKAHKKSLVTFSQGFVGVAGKNSNHFYADLKILGRLSATY